MSVTLALPQLHPSHPCCNLNWQSHLTWLTWVMPCHSQSIIGHRPLDSIQLCLELALPSSSSCTWSLSSTFSRSLFQLFLGRPLPSQPCCSAWLAMLSSLLLSVCPSQFHCALVSFSLTGSSTVFFYSSLLDILSGPCTFMIFHKHLLMKTCNLSKVHWATVRDSDA